MAGNIIVAGQEAATNADILQGTRLQSAPGPGSMTFELQAADSDGTNFGIVSVQMPGGQVPMSAVRIPCGNSTGLAGVIDERTDLQATFPVTQGGHTTFDWTETGDTELSWRITYRPLAIQ